MTNLESIKANIDMELLEEYIMNIEGIDTVSSITLKKVKKEGTIDIYTNNQGEELKTTTLTATYSFTDNGVKKTINIPMVKLNNKQDVIDITCFEWEYTDFGGNFNYLREEYND